MTDTIVEEVIDTSIHVIDKSKLSPFELENLRLEKLAAKKARREQKRANYKIYHKEKRNEQHVKRQEAKKQMLIDHLEKFPEEERDIEMERMKERRIHKHLKQTEFDEDAHNNGMKIVINCGFSHIMEGKELTSLCKQLMYARNFYRQNSIPISLHFSSWPGEDSDLGIRAAGLGLPRWKAHYHSKPFWEVFNVSDVIVLSPDAEEDLEDEIDFSKIYIVGGIVDRTISKFETASQAKEIGVTMRKLPFKQHIGSIKNFVLNVNTVIEILSMLRSGVDMENSLKRAIPARKQDNKVRNTKGSRGKIIQVNRKDECGNEVDVSNATVGGNHPNAE